jgi:hypothetical protein
MKIAAALLSVLLVISSVRGQEPAEQPGFHEHDGFFLSLSGGPVYQRLDDELGSLKLTFSGAGSLVDVRIGGTVGPNLVISGDIIGRVISKPDVEVEGIGSANSNFDLTESTVGAGITYYFMPVNIFVAGTVGLTRFGIASGGGVSVSTTDPGLSLYFKVGKEWWVGADWGLGVAASFAFSGVSNTVGSLTEDLSGASIGIHFNATYH